MAMVKAGACALLCVAVLGASTGAPASASTGAPVRIPPAPGEVILRGTGTAHGLGMAMDGVEAQARAGWSRDRILDLFYPGTTPGRASGTIRVGLANEPATALALPNGGVISNAPRGAPAGVGFPITLPVGSRITARTTTGGVALTLPPRPARSPAPRAEPATSKGRPPGAGLGSKLVPPRLLEPTPSPTPKPAPTRPPSGGEPGSPSSAPSGGAALSASGVPKRVFVWGTGDPALVSVAATGRRYRGSIEVVPHGGRLNVVNHVDLETYVAGIAEEKGAGWPVEALKVLAIAARTLGAATMSWYEKNQANGYDICPTDQCQVYLGYDGEEESMRQATRETAGVIRTYHGRPILAMYHGNGGGQTETYKRLIDYGGDPHPYLRSVRYPHADPYHWTRRETWTSIDASLRAAGVAIPGPLRGMDVLERGDSPRIVKLRLHGADGDVDITGQRFMDALDLWSTWFDIETATTPVATTAVVDPGIGLPVPPAPLSTSDEQSQRTWYPLLTALLAMVALLWATSLVARELPGFSVRGALLYGSDAAG